MGWFLSVHPLLFVRILKLAKYKICPVCGRQFKTCTTCENSSIPSWKKYTDSFEHYDIYSTVILYTRHEITKEEAADRLNSYPRSGYNESIQKFVDEIFYIDRAAIDEVEVPKVSTLKRRRRNKETVFGQDETQ